MRRILEHCHLQTVHAGGGGGAAATLSKVRQKYWVTSYDFWTRVRNTCNHCKKFPVRVLKASPTSVLPTFRKKFTEPLTVIRVNFAGPLLYRSGMDQTSKAYVALFTCASTSAFHLGHPNRWSVRTPKRFNLQKLFVDNEAKTSYNHGQKGLIIFKNKELLYPPRPQYRTLPDTATPLPPMLIS